MTTDDTAGPRDNGVLLAVGYAFAILMPIVGLIIGLTQLRRGGGGIVNQRFAAECDEVLFIVAGRAISL